MNINEVLQGLSNLGGEMPRVTKPKRIKEIKPGKKNSNVRKRRGPMNIDLSKLGEDKPNHLKAKSKVTKKVKPSTGHESPNINRGKFVGEADDEGMYNNPELRRAAKRDQAVNKEFAIGNFYAWAMEKYPNITLGQMKQKFPSLQREYGQEKAMRRAEPNKVPTVTPAFDDEKERLQAKGIKREEVDEVAGAKDCWPGYRKDGTQPGTGKNKGKRVNKCVKAENVSNTKRK